MKQYFSFLLVSFFIPLYMQASQPADNEESKAHLWSKRKTACFVSFVGIVVTGSSILSGIRLANHFNPKASLPAPFPPPPSQNGLGCWTIAMTNVGPHNNNGASFKPLCSPVNATSPGINGACPQVNLEFMEMMASDCSRTQAHPCYSAQEVEQIFPQYCKDFTIFPPLAVPPAEISSREKLRNKIRSFENARRAKK